jgi:four helix bundle protein
MNEPTKSFEELNVWKNAHLFSLSVYKETENFPKSELFGLTSQFRRAAVSISANIAEGYKKKGKLDKMRFFNISQGSLEECRYFIILSRDLNYITSIKHDEMNLKIQEVSKLLNAYYRAISNST